MRKILDFQLLFCNPYQGMYRPVNAGGEGHIEPLLARYDSRCRLSLEEIAAALHSSCCNVNTPGNLENLSKAGAAKFFNTIVFKAQFHHEISKTMKKGTHTDQTDAFGLFPDLMKNLVGTKDGKRRKKSLVRPPPIPDLSQLRKGVYQEQEQVKDIPSALVLMGEERDSSAVSSGLQDLGYRIETVDSPIEALVKLQSNSFATVLMHAEFGGESLAESTIYNYMKWLPILKRRSMFYILVGPDFRTMYDLEALALSANLVINDADIEFLKTILKKSFRNHEELFGPLFEAMKGYEKL
jgi:hypothetical protein